MNCFLRFAFLFLCGFSALFVSADSINLYVDDPAKVELTKAWSFDGVFGLDPGWNTMEYNPESDTVLLVRSKGGTGCYSVKKDGVSVGQSNSGLYEVPLENGSTVEILSEFPAEDFPVKFIFNGCMESCLEYVWVNYKEITDFASPDFAVKAGARIDIMGNTDEYMFDSFKVNGEEVDKDFYTAYHITVTEPLTFEITAHRYRDFAVTVNLSDSKGVAIYRGASSNGTLLNLSTGANTVILNESSPRITVIPEDGYKLIEFTTELGGEIKDCLPSYSQYNKSITVSEGMEINISVAELEKITNVVYVDNIEKAGSDNLIDSSWKGYPFQEGYNVYTLTEGENSFRFMPSAMAAAVYVNSEEIYSSYDTWPLYEFTPAQGDVVKIFMDSAPQSYEVKIDAGVDAGVEVWHDVIVPVTDFSAPLTVLGATRITIKPIDDEGFSVSLNGVNVLPEDGVYAFDVTENSTVAFGRSSGVETVGADAREALWDIYNMQGICVGRSVSRDCLQSLPAGLYVINGVKTVVRH